MKKKIAILLALLLMLSGCGKKPAEETQPAETVPATETVQETAPELEDAVAQINGVPAVLVSMSRGDTVDIVSAYDEAHYVVKLELGYGLVEKNLVRMELEPAFEPWTGYAYQGADLYSNYRLSGDPVKKLEADTQVEVIDNLGSCFLVSWDGTDGYMVPESLAKKPDEDGQKKGSSGKKNQPAVGEDGGEISMKLQGGISLLANIAPQQGDVTGKAKVLADGTEIILGYFDRGDRIPMVTGGPSGGYYEIYLDGLYARVSAQYIQLDGGKAFEEWEGRTNAITALYSDLWMLGSPSDRLNANTKVQVLYELDDCYLVEAGDVMGYAAKDKIEPAEEAPAKETKPAANPTTATEPTTPEEETKATEPAQGSTGDAVTQPTQPTQPTEPEVTVPETELAEDAGNEETPKETTGNTDPEWTPPML